MLGDSFKVNARIVPTQLGKAAFSSCIPPEYSLHILNDLWQARENLILETDLHLLFLVTPHFRNLWVPDWENFEKVYKRMSIAEQDVAKFYNISIDYLSTAQVYKLKLPEICLNE